MELRVLNYFLAVAREQSIVRAAESLHLTQPTLSTQLKALEEELGKPLLIRGTRGSRKITLTEEGMILRKRAEEIMSLVSKAKNEISFSEDIIMGDVHIGTGETDGVRLLARTARALSRLHPGIRYHMASGNADFVFDQLDKGLIDFGLVFGMADQTKYNCLELPIRDVWGVLMPKDVPLAQKAAIAPEDLWPLPLILPRQGDSTGDILGWMGRTPDELDVIGTYNLIFNASLMVEEGLGYAVGLDKIINTTGESGVCFRPLTPRREAGMTLIWKKYQLLSRAARQFIDCLEKSLA